MNSYFTLDNGGYPFRVDVHPTNKVELFVRDAKKSTIADTDIYYDQPKRIWRKVDEIWVGQSPLTETTAFSGGHGPKFDGNSLLLQLPQGEYVFIGSQVLQFRPLTPIVKYVSEVGNSGVPYPHAVDQAGNYYLLVENVVLTQVPPNTTDIYRWFYTQQKMTPEIRLRHSTPAQIEQQRKAWTRTEFWEFFIGKEPFTLTYATHPGKEFDRLVKMGQEDSQLGELSVVTQKSYPRRITLARITYVTLMKTFGRRMGFSGLTSRTLVPRVSF